MSSSTSSSKRFLVYLAGFLILFEAAALLLPVHRGRHELDDCTAALEHSKTTRTLLLSDSVTHNILTSSDAASIALFDCSTNRVVSLAGQFFLAKRWLDRHPDLEKPNVLLVLHPRSLNYDLDDELHLETYFTSIFNRLDEIEDVSQTLLRPVLASTMQKNRLERLLTPPSNYRAGHPQRRVSDELRSMKDHLIGARHKVPKTNSVKNRMAIDRLVWQTLEPSEVTDRYLQKLAETLQEQDGQLYLLVPPIPPSLRTAWQKSILPEYMAYLSSFAGAHANVTFVPPLYVPEEDRFFRDGIHLHVGARSRYRDELVRWSRNLLTKEK